MMVAEQIRMMREVRQWSQEDMADKLNMSVSGYARLERGETKLHLDKLEKIAKVFDMDVLELMQSLEKGVVFFMADNGDNAQATYYHATYYGEQSSASEIEKLNLIITHKDELLAQKDALLEQKENELKSLRSVIEFLQRQS